MAQELILPKTFVDLLNYQGDDPNIIFAKSYFISQWHIRDIERVIAIYLGKESDLKFDNVTKKILHELLENGFSQTFNEINEHFSSHIVHRKELESLYRRLSPNIQYSNADVLGKKNCKSEEEFESLEQIFRDIMDFCENMKQHIIPHDRDQLKMYLDEIITIYQVRLIFKLLPNEIQLDMNNLSEIIKGMKDELECLTKKISERDELMIEQEESKQPLERRLTEIQKSLQQIQKGKNSIIFRMFAAFRQKKLMEIKKQEEDLIKEKESIENQIDEKSSNKEFLRKRNNILIKSRIDLKIKIMVLEKLNELLSRESWISKAYKKLGIISSSQVNISPRIHDLHGFVLDFLRPLNKENLNDNEWDFDDYDGIACYGIFYRQSSQIYNMVQTMFNPEILELDNILEICQTLLQNGRM